MSSLIEHNYELGVRFACILLVGLLSSACSVYQFELLATYRTPGSRDACVLFEQFLNFTLVGLARV